jgi:hypothetical protein
MKRLILSEGKNDTIFLKELLTTKMRIEENKILFFDQDSHMKAENLKFLQDRYFDKLQSEWMPYELLAKSEGGKTKIIDITVSKLCYLCEQGQNPIMLVDLDGGSINRFTDKLEEKLINRFRGANLTIKQDELLKIDEALMWSMKLFKNTKLIGTIYVIGFYKTLEQVTGIKNGVHTDEEKRSFAKTYIKDSHIYEMFVKALQ